MKILITGISGLIGTTLKDFLISQGHAVSGFSLKNHNTHTLDQIKDRLENSDVIISLSGETIAQRWTTSAKKRIYDSRIDSTQLLVKAILKVHKPKIFLSASAFSIYETHNTLPATEFSPLASKNDFIRRVLKDWEAATFPLDDIGIRRINLRFGTVLSRKGGFLAKMLGPFNWGLGGHQGSGKQLISWIDIDDLVRAIYFCILDAKIQGPVNLVAPQVITNDQLCKALGMALKRPVWLSVPSWALEFLLGKEFAQEMILKSYNVYPKKLLDAGFVFNYPIIEQSLNHLLK